MPFYLVTKTSLVEAQDEQEAAQTDVDYLRSGGEVTVSVKSDETTITHVTVAALKEEPLISRPKTGNQALIMAAAPETASAALERRKIILKRMMADVLVIMGRRT